MTWRRYFCCEVVDASVKGEYAINAMLERVSDAASVVVPSTKSSTDPPLSPKQRVERSRSQLQLQLPVIHANFRRSATNVELATSSVRSIKHALTGSSL
jgi:hypothetical protein